MVSCSAPYTWRLYLGWIIVYNVCLEKVHKLPTINIFLTCISEGGYITLFEPHLNTDSSVKHYRVSPNDVLISRPELSNTLVWVCTFLLKETVEYGRILEGPHLWHQFISSIGDLQPQTSRQEEPAELQFGSWTAYQSGFLYCWLSKIASYHWNERNPC